MNSGRIFTDMQIIEVNILFTEIEENNCISIYKLGDNTTHHSRNVSKNIQFDLFNFSQRIRSNEHELTVGCLISMRNLCMKLRYSLHKDDGFANELNQL